MTLDLIALSDPNSAAAEAYRQLRTNLVFAGVPMETVLVAAATADQNKASVVANLAVSFANIGKRVLIADCDLRRPAMHRLFQLANDSGVTTALQNGERPLLQATGVPGLQVLTSGPAVPVAADLLASTRMNDLIAQLRTMAEIVLFDAPPVVLSTDAANLASRVDGVVLAVSVGHTKRHDAEQAKEILGRVGAHIVGAILVNAPANAALHKYLTG